MSSRVRIDFKECFPLTCLQLFSCEEGDFGACVPQRVRHGGEAGNRSWEAGSSANALVLGPKRLTTNKTLGAREIGKTPRTLNMPP
jgi:hypothetical protein